MLSVEQSYVWRHKYFELGDQDLSKMNVLQMSIFNKKHRNADVLNQLFCGLVNFLSIKIDV